MKKLILIIALLAVVGFSSQASAGVHFNVGVGLGGYPYGYYGPYYGSPYYYGYGPSYYDYGPAIYIGPGYYSWHHGYWHGGYVHHYHHH